MTHHTSGYRTGIYGYTCLCCMLFFAMACLSPAYAQNLHDAPSFRWTELPSMPDSIGFAGCFAGVSNGALVVAGGANFPDGGAPWTGSRKVWSDKIFVLDKPDGQWKVAGTLPQPLGYGVSVSWNNTLVCIGGSSAAGHSAGVFSIQYDGQAVLFENLPSLPRPLANATGALSGNTIYIAGGLFSPESTTTAHCFWSVDLLQEGGKRRWKELETWPGAPRMLAVAGVQNGSFFLFSGTDLKAAQGEQPVRRYLQDAYRFTPGRGWKKIPDLPQAVVAAPGPAYRAGERLFIFGGDDGRLSAEAQVLKAGHPGFSDVILAYHTGKQTWSAAGKIKTVRQKDAAAYPNRSVWAPVTTPLVVWEGRLVFPGGEVRPAVRTPKVIVAEAVFKKHAQ